MKRYIVSEVPANRIRNNKETVYYCHDRRYPDIPVFGSIGSKAKANRICKQMNQTAKED